MNKTLQIAAALWLAGSATSWAVPITLEQLNVPFNLNVGMAYQDTTQTLIVSRNYPNGVPRNFDRVSTGATPTLTAFSSASGYTDEVNLAIALAGQTGGWTQGEVIAGTGVEGVLARISPDGSVVNSNWVSLPGSNGLFRGELAFDRTGLWGGDLIAVTTNGQVWRITEAGVPTLVRSLGVALSSVITLPDDPRYGDLAGKIVVGSDSTQRLYTIDAAGNVEFFNIGLTVEDLQLILPDTNMYGVDYGGGRLFGAEASNFTGFAGDIVLVQEFGSGAGTHLFRLTWDVALDRPVATPFVETGDGMTPVAVEKVVFTSIGTGPIEAVVPRVQGVPEPASAALLLAAALGGAALRRRPRP